MPSTSPDLDSYRSSAASATQTFSRYGRFVNPLSPKAQQLDNRRHSSRRNSNLGDALGLSAPIGQGERSTSSNIIGMPGARSGRRSEPSSLSNPTSSFRQTGRYSASE